MHLCVDTNFLLQCRDARELEWADVTDAPEVRLYLVRTVQREIDRHKAGGNARRADRARRVSTLIRTILKAPERFVCLREANPRVTLALVPRAPFDRVSTPGLDLDQADDRIIDEIIAFRDASPEREIALLTDDTNPMATADEVGLAYVAIPDRWRLPPEPTSADKTLADLTRRVASLEKQSPKIEIAAQDASGASLSKLHLTQTYYTALTDREIERLVETAKRQYPRQQEWPEPKKPGRSLSTPALSGLAAFGANIWIPPTGHEIKSYFDRYEQWLKTLKNALSNIHAIFARQDTAVSIVFLLTNPGGRPAENLIAEFDCRGAIDIARDDAEQRRISTGLNAPPQSPKGYYGPAGLGGSHRYAGALMRDMARASAFDTMPSFNPKHLRPERNPNKFYYTVRHKGFAKRWELKCAEFRHRLDPEDVPWVVTGRAWTGDQAKGAISVRLSASNLPDVVETIIPVIATRTMGDTYARVVELLSPKLLLHEMGEP